MEQGAPRVPVFSPPHNGGSRVENLWIMKSLTQGDAHTNVCAHTHARKHTHIHIDTRMRHLPHLCKKMPVHLRNAHNIMIMGIAGIAVLLLWETAAAPKLLSSLLLTSHPLIYQLP